MNSEQMRDLAVEALEDLKCLDLRTLDVRKMTGMTDFMLVCSGSSQRHVKSMADNVAALLKKSGVQPLGTEGEKEGDWILVDLGEVVVHVMLPEARQFYDIERLWSVTAESRRNQDEN